MWESDGCEKGSIVGSEILQKKKNVGSEEVGRRMPWAATWESEGG